MPNKNISHAIEWANRSEWLTEPQQERSRQSLIKIIDAAVTLFCDKGYDATSIAEISRLSKVSVGAIYTRFSDKKSILHTVIESYYRTRKIQYDSIIEQVDSQALTPGESLHAYLDVMFSGFNSDHALICFVERQRLVDSLVAEQAEQLLTHVEAGLKTLLTPHAACLRLADIAQTSHALNAIVYNTLALQSLHYAQNKTLAYEDYIAPIQNELTIMSERYLGI